MNQETWDYYERCIQNDPNLYHEKRQEACDRILALEREWRQDPTWQPKYLNGFCPFELKVRKYIYG